MVRDLLLILLGLDIGTASPHLANMANYALAKQWEGIATEWDIAWRSFLVEGIVALFMIGFLLVADRRRERQETEKDRAKASMIVETVGQLGTKIDASRDELKNEIRKKG